MDLLTGLKNEVFRPLASVVLPGVLALAPHVVIICNSIPGVLHLYQSQPAWFFVGVVGAGTVVGMLLEDVGTSIERGIDRCMDLEYLFGHEKVWLAYLSKGTEDTNGRRFLGATVTRLKFLNSLMPALFLFMLGIVWLNWQTGFWTAIGAMAFCIFILLLLSWMFRTSTELSEVASATRFCLIDRGDRPPEYDVDADPVRRTRHFAYAVGELITSRVASIDLRGRNPWCVIPESFLIFFGFKKTKTESPATPLDPG